MIVVAVTKRRTVGDLMAGAGPPGQANRLPGMREVVREERRREGEVEGTGWTDERAGEERDDHRRQSVSLAGVRPAAGRVAAGASVNNPQVKMLATNPLAQPAGFGLRPTHLVSGFSRGILAAAATSP